MDVRCGSGGSKEQSSLSSLLDILQGYFRDVSCLFLWLNPSILSTEVVQSERCKLGIALVGSKKISQCRFSRPFPEKILSLGKEAGHDVLKVVRYYSPRGKEARSKLQKY